MKEDFVSKEEKTFYFMLGRTLASGLSGFIAGIIVMLIIMLVVLVSLTI